MSGRMLMLLCVALLCAALAVRIAAGWWWQTRVPAGRPFYFGDSETYWRLAEALAAGRPYAYGDDAALAFRTPGYPWLLSWLFWLRGGEPPVEWARVLSAACGTAGVAMLMFWTWRLFADGRAVLAAGTLMAFYPGAVAQGAFVLAEAPFVTVMLLQLMLWTEALQHAGRGRWALAAGAGFAAAVAVLLRPSWLLFTPFAAGLGLILARDRLDRGALSAVACCGLCLGMAPWWIRNYVALGAFVPTTTQVGASLYDGLRPDADGGSDMRFVAEQTAAEKAERAARPKPQPLEITLDDRMRNAAWRWAGDHPGRALQLAGVKFLRMWSPLPNEAGLSSPWLQAITALSFVPVAGAIAVGLGRRRLSPGATLMCATPAAYFTVLHVIFVSSLRYREPAVVAALPLAVAAVFAPRVVESKHPALN